MKTAERAQLSYERRMSAIACFDVVGYSKLINERGELVFSSLRYFTSKAKSIAETYSGELFGLAGDSFLIEFPNSVLAMRCVDDIQKQFSNTQETPTLIPLTFRIGVTYGSILVDEDTRFGDDVNISARLQELSPPGGFAVSETIFMNVDGRLPIDFIDMGEHALKNIPYPVRIYCNKNQKSSRAATFKPFEKGKFEPSRVRLAVLPFTIENGLAENKYLSGAVADEIIHTASRHRWLRVLSRTSSFQFSNENASLEKIASVLKADFIVTGHLKFVDDQVHINVLLHDSKQSEPLTEDVYNVPSGELFKLREYISTNIVAKLSQVLRQVQIDTSKNHVTSNAESWHLVHRGHWHMQQSNRKDMKIARGLYEAALDQDPEMVEAMLGLSWWYFWMAWMAFYNRDIAAELAAAENYAFRAHLLDKHEARAICHLGAIEVLRRRPERAIKYLEESVELNPSHAFSHAGLGSAYLLASRPEQGLKHLLRGQELSPADPYSFHNLGEISASYLFSGMYEKAKIAATRASTLAPGFWYAYVLRICASEKLNPGKASESERKNDIINIFNRYPEFKEEWIRAIPLGNEIYREQLLSSFNNALNL